MSKPCKGCGTTIEQCEKWRRVPPVIACCPDCEHEEEISDNKELAFFRVFIGGVIMIFVICFYLLWKYFLGGG